jgi:hypothetical protein
VQEYQAACPIHWRIGMKSIANTAFKAGVASVAALMVLVCYSLAQEEPKVGAPFTMKAKAIVANLKKPKNFSLDQDAKLLARKLQADQAGKQHAFLGAKVPADFAPPRIKQRLSAPLHKNVKVTTTLENFNPLGNNDTTFHGHSFPVQDQGDCGCCWIFGSVGAYDANYIASLDKDVNAAEQHILNCVQTTDSDACNGGWPADALDFLTNAGTGTRGDPKMAYLARRDTCDPNAAIKFKAVRFGYVNPNSPGQVPDTEELKQAIFQYGAVVVAVNATNYFMAYKNGKFDLNEGGDINHAVALVGWTTEDKVVYWRLRNSWSNTWGENGYMWIKAGSNQVGFGAMWVTASPDSNGGGIKPCPCPCPDKTPPNYNAEVLRRIDFWTKNFPQHAFPK